MPFSIQELFKGAGSLHPMKRVMSTAAMIAWLYFEQKNFRDTLFPSFLQSFGLNKDDPIQNFSIVNIGYNTIEQTDRLQYDWIKKTGKFVQHDKIRRSVLFDGKVAQQTPSKGPYIHF
jgi:hypothetical protein